MQPLWNEAVQKIHVESIWFCVKVPVWSFKTASMPFTVKALGGMSIRCPLNSFTALQPQESRVWMSEGYCSEIVVRSPSHSIMSSEIKFMLREVSIPTVMVSRILCPSKPYQ